MKRINVTKTFLPPYEEYEVYAKKIWESGQLTNQGPLLQEFEQQAKTYLNVDNFHFVSNGTIALQVALRALDIIEGEVITTPFSYVATTSAILWEKLKPVFVDIEPRTYCIDPLKIEEAITPKTKAIMAVHVFGNPCDVEAIEKIAQKHKLKVIYDGAHAFGATYKDKSLLDYGDITTCSFHATKLFHTIEGGAVIARDNEISSKIELIKRFGHNLDDHITLGINAKSSEFQAAMGLCNLKYIDENIKARKKIFDMYQRHLNSSFVKPSELEQTNANYSYYSIVMKNEDVIRDSIAELNSMNIYPRRYFYPSLNRLTYLSETMKCPVSEDIATKIMCLPVYVGLEEEDVIRISQMLNKW